tara:strand:+ start:3864 stop:4028 length:165 start_codon:yes stop_codon:yes gene_type:complete
MSKYIVKIINTKTHEVVKTLKATSQRMAIQLQNGVEINLNHDEYHVDVVKMDQA